MRPRLRFLLPFLSFAALALSPRGVWAACTPIFTDSCAALCDPGSTATVCLVQSCKYILSDVTFDCTGRDVRLETGAAKIRIRDALMVLRARDLVIGALGSKGASGARIEARGGDPSRLDFGMVLELTGGLDVAGRLSAQGKYGGGRIVVRAAGAVTLRSTSPRRGVDASATKSSQPGGLVQIRSGGNVTIARRVRADAKTETGALGGTIEIGATGDVAVSELLSAHGAGWGDERLRGGEISIQAGGHVQIDGAGLLDVAGHGPFGSGGEVQISAYQLTLGGGPGAALPRISAVGSVDAANGTAAGGRVWIDVGPGGVLLHEYAAIELRGGTGGDDQFAGAVEIESEGDLVLEDRVAIEAPAVGNSGDGGVIALRASGRLAIGEFAEIDARARPSVPGGSRGPAIEISACRVEISRAAELKTNGFTGGPVTVVGRRELAFDGHVDAGGAAGGDDGTVVLAYGIEKACSDDGSRACDNDGDCAAGTCVVVNPVLGPDADFDPAPTLTHQPTLLNCD
jgi:hypothetical protein